MKLDRNEVIEREARRREYEAKIRENKEAAKLIKKLDFKEKPLILKLGIYSLRALGLIFGLILVISLIY